MASLAEEEVEEVLDLEEENLSPEEKLLLSARNGMAESVKDLLLQRKRGNISFDINCKGNTKANRGWTPLHLAAYFGHTEVAEILLEFGADVNVVNNVGDSPLHRAAYTGRVETVTLLLNYYADVSIINAEGLTAKSITNHKEIKNLITATETHETLRRNEEFLSSVRKGDVECIKGLLESSSTLDIHCTDSYGNTALHIAAQADKKEVAVFLLQQGCQTTSKNSRDEMPSDIAWTNHMKQLLGIKPSKDYIKQPQRTEGTLLKKSRFLGYKPVWVVIERGVFSIFKNRGDASTGARRKGMKYLDEAEILIPDNSSLEFLIYYSDGAKHSFSVDPNDTVNISRQKWVNSLLEHITFSTHYTHQGERHETSIATGTIEDSLKTAQAHQTLLEKQMEHVTKSFTQLEVTQNSIQPEKLNDLREQLQKLSTQSKETCTSLSKCLTLLTQHDEQVVEEVNDLKNGLGSTITKCIPNRTICGFIGDVHLVSHGKVFNEALMCPLPQVTRHPLVLQHEQYCKARSIKLKEEMEKSRVLQEALHALATEHHELEKSVVSVKPHPRYYDTDDDEFYDCDEEDDMLSTNGIDIQRSDSFPESFMDTMSFKSVESNYISRMDNKQKNGTFSQYGRMCLPVKMFDRNDFSIWSILKQCIGKELSKITMPVVFNEPLSFLQRISEYMEYGHLLEKASITDDPLDRMTYVAAFAVSSVSSNLERIGKPFNPLLGETFELDRPDLGFKLMGEQVSHHPPISAFHAESEHFKINGSIHPKLKFWGKSVEINPKGVITLELTRFGEVYTWSNVNCCVHNVIVGRLWVEHYGIMEITNHKTDHKCVLNFKQAGWFGKDLHKVEGFIYNQNREKLKALYGSWILDIYAVDVETYENFMKNSGSPSQNNSAKTNGATGNSDISDDIPTKSSSSYDLHIPTQQIVWKAVPRPEHSSEYFCFTAFAMALNEMREDMCHHLPPTDSRFRPDIRLLEDGQIDLAASEKNRVEEKQRGARKERKKKKEEWSPVWFRYGVNKYTNKEDWLFKGDYWSRDWTKCPDIF